MTKSIVSNALVRAVALPTIATLIVLAAIVGAILHFSASRTDQLARARQLQRMNVAIEQSMLAVAIDQEASTFWDDAVIRTRQRPLDLEWLDNNLGIWFHTYYHFDEAYLLDAGDRPVYAMQAGKRTLPASFSRIRKPAAQLAWHVRDKLAVSYLAPDGERAKTVGASEIAIVAGRPAIVSLKPIVSETGEVVQRAGSEYLHVGVRYLDGDFLQQMARLYGIDKPRFSLAKPSRASVTIRSTAGHTLGYISWRPFEPGRQVAQKMVPALLLALFIVGALVCLLLLRIRRSRSELEASRSQAQYMAFHDSLTGLPNRALFEARLAFALSRRDAEVAVLLIDLDRFKNVNDTLGHQAGDRLICEFGSRLSALVRHSDTVARLGGDEFAILVETGSATETERLAERILADVKRPFEIFGAHAYVGASIGIAFAEGSGCDPLELVRKADIALYRVKDGGRNGYRLFSPDMDDSVKLRRTIEEELRAALVKGKGLCLHYQPLVGSDGRIVGLEALVRWQHRRRGLIAPDQFIPVAEETGMIVPLGDWVLREACRASRRWDNLFIAINLSPVQFHAPDFFERLMRIVEKSGADPHSIQLEVTERVLIDDDDSIRSIFARLRAVGFTIVLDDFGTGYSSLSYLHKFEFDKIKIDGSFVQHLGEEGDSAAIVTAVLALGWAMGLTVSAEGIETAEQCTFLEGAGCKELQGHYFSPALPADEIAPLLAGNGPSAAAA